MYNVAVVGCGIIGLTSALKIQEKLGNKVKVTIFTNEVSPNTTSDIAAGLWDPYLCANTPEENVIRWSKASLDYFLHLWKVGEAKKYAICLQPAYFLSCDPNYTLPNWAKLTPGYSELSKEHLGRLNSEHKANYTGGVLFTTLTYEGSTLLPVLQVKFISNGGRIIKQTIKDLCQLSDYDVIVNCSGYEARNIVPDNSVKPIRGQIARVIAPWQFHAILVDRDQSNYIIPNVDSVVVGGTKQIDDNLEVNENDKQRIFSGCADIIPSIRNVKILKDIVGLRPSRDAVRLEIEMKSFGGKNLYIIHNYGHGGSGLTFSIGCANDAADLCQDILERIKSKL